MAVSAVVLAVATLALQVDASEWNKVRKVPIQDFVGVGNDSDRIINGYPIPEGRPFLVNLFVKYNDAWGFTCTGTLISPRHVLTAAHCFCIDEDGDGQVDCSEELIGKPKEVPSKMLPMTNIFLNKQNRNLLPTVQAQRIRIHDNYNNFFDPSPYDMALVTLKKPVALSKTVGVIPLPTDGTVDVGVQVLAAGWGAIRTEGSCYTDQFGPKRFELCFGVNQPKPCTTDKPAPVSAACQHFFAHADLKDLSKEARVIQVDKNVCYRPDPKGYGWCYTNKKKTAWGFCMRTCSFEMFSGPEEIPEEVALETAEGAVCGGDPTKELCAGGFLRSADVYYYTQSKTDPNKYTRLDRVTRGNKLKNPGFKDTCQGDSGGPLWTEKPDLTLVGVTSRGDGCGLKRTMGVYGRVKTAVTDFLKKWMDEDGK